MDKREYLELAKKKGWDTKIPLSEGYYNCDLFGGDNVKIHSIILIIGNVSLGDNADFSGIISVNGNLTFGDYASIHDVKTDGNITFGDYADVRNVSRSYDIVFGDYARIHNVETDGNITFGDYADVQEVSCSGDMVFGDYARIFHVLYLGKFTVGDYAILDNLFLPIPGKFACGKGLRHLSQVYPAYKQRWKLVVVSTKPFRWGQVPLQPGECDEYDLSKYLL